MNDTLYIYERARAWCEARDTCTSSREPVERSWRSSTRESRLPGCWTALACRHCTKRTEAVASCSVSAASCSQYCCATVPPDAVDPEESPALLTLLPLPLPLPLPLLLLPPLPPPRRSFSVGATYVAGWEAATTAAIVSTPQPRSTRSTPGSTASAFLATRPAAW